MEHNTVSVLLVESQHLAQVPGDCFSLAVFIGSQPHLLCGLGILLQLTNQSLLLFWYLIIGTQGVEINAYLFLFEVTDVSIARHHFEVFAKKLLNGFRLGGALYDY